jgi:hypothetical protein
MCYGAEAVYIGAALAAAGAATSSYANSQQLKKQDQIAAQGIVQQGALKKQGQQDVGQNIQSVAQSNQASQAKSAQQLSSFRSALQEDAPQNASADPSVPGASKAFAQEQAKSGASASNYVDAIAKSAATTQGTQLERVDEGNAMGATAGKLGVLSGESSEQSYLTKLQIQSTQANPWISGLGKVLSGAGAVVGAGAGAVGAGVTGGVGLAANAGSSLASAKGNSVGVGTAASDYADQSQTPFGGNTVENA